MGLRQMCSWIVGWAMFHALRPFQDESFKFLDSVSVRMVALGKDEDWMLECKEVFVALESLLATAENAPLVRELICRTVRRVIVYDRLGGRTGREYLQTLVVSAGDLSQDSAVAMARVLDAVSYSAKYLNISVSPDLWSELREMSQPRQMLRAEI